ncbi:insect cuticle protein domain-containing protein [Phthorimaea operculella]|nr:insect cuticle protein domain-containing protein [Phthorimaea operculella]
MKAAHSSHCLLNCTRLAAERSRSLPSTKSPCFSIYDNSAPTCAAVTNLLGSYSYVDPRQKVRTVDYVADKQGFHPVLSDVPPEHPADSESVARAKDRHFQLYQQIAEQHANNPHPQAADVVAPRQSAAVVAAAAKHAHLFQVIAEQHARIAAEREALQREEEQQQYQELQDQQ